MPAPGGSPAEISARRLSGYPQLAVYDAELDDIAKGRSAGVAYTVPSASPALLAKSGNVEPGPGGR